CPVRTSFLRLATLVAAAFCLFCFSAPAQTPQAAATYAITHAKIFTLAGSMIDDGTLIIKDGKIAAVGTSVEGPAGRQGIERQGLQGFPGPFDAVTKKGLS